VAEQTRIERGARQAIPRPHAEDRFDIESVLDIYKTEQGHSRGFHAQPPYRPRPLRFRQPCTQHQDVGSTRSSQYPFPCGIPRTDSLGS
jgi:hypothetical protein